ncbi:hypothetical protein M8C21_012069 [Ambrosia artemisiifolia]|uniref:Uncharacterized protein n=1 Tax=Ambrosia artemisiifolia TaxID=4212 RepID=A0AAD5CTC0_AMBAR|nr:hypothetical protein M8C21_012069 [Ambrosia artemisiifolia]
MSLKATVDDDCNVYAVERVVAELRSDGYIDYLYICSTKKVFYGKYPKRLDVRAPVYFAATLEYLTSDTWKLLDYLDGRGTGRPILATSQLVMFELQFQATKYFHHSLIAGSTKSSKKCTSFMTKLTSKKSKCHWSLKLIERLGKITLIWKNGLLRDRYVGGGS